MSTAAAKSLQSCPILCNPIDGSPPGSPIPGILQEITLEWVAISLYNAGKWKWSRSVVSDSSGPHGLQPTRLLHPWDLPGKSTGVGCHRLLWLDAQMYLIEVFVCISLMANELIIFSCIYLPSVYPLWWNVCFVCFVHLKKISLFSFWLHWVFLWLHVGFL